MSEPNSNFVSYSRCEICDLRRIDQHPIQHCPRCESEAYDLAFAELRKKRAYTHILGVDVYADCIYIWADGVVAAIEGRVDKLMRTRKVDDLVRRVTDLEAENRDLLAENARFRRRLEPKKDT